MKSYWFGDVDDGKCIPFSGDAAAYSRRVRVIRTNMDVFVPPDWKIAAACGICRDRAEYLSLLQKVCIAGSEQAVREQYAAKDVELLQMVRTLDEMDTVINVLSERVADWYQ
ncbi:MAG: RNA-processing protein, partial [Methanoregula sp.]